MLKRNIHILFSFVLLMGCSDELVFNVSSQKSKIVVAASGYLDSTIRFKLVENQIITDDTATVPIGQAEVRLYRNNQLVESLKSDLNGYLVSNYQVKANDTLRLNIRKDGYDLISSEAVVPNEIQLIIFDTIPTRLGNNLGLRLVIDDQVEVNNYYLLELYVERWTYEINPINMQRTDSTLTLDPQTINSASKVFFSDQNIVTNPEKYQLFTDKIFDGQIYQLNININYADLAETVNKGKAQRIEARLRCINEDYYHFLTSLSLNRPIYGGPFAISTQVGGNIIGGYGYFALNSLVTASIRLK